MEQFDYEVMHAVETFKGRFISMKIEQIRYCLEIEFRRLRKFDMLEQLTKTSNKYLFDLISLDNEVVNCGKDKNKVKIKFRR